MKSHPIGVRLGARYSFFAALLLVTGFAIRAEAQSLHVFVHYDYMVLADQGTACTATTDCDAGQACIEGICRGHSHKPDPKAIQAAADAFARQGIRLHVDPVSHAIPERQVVSFPGYLNPACSGNDAVTIDELRAAVPQANPPHVHYGVFGHWALCPDYWHCFACPADENSSRPQPYSTGFAELPGRNFAVTFGAFVDIGEPVLFQEEAGTFMHELGHNLGLRHGGFENDNFKPNYISVMNYLYQLNGILVAKSPGSTEYAICAADSDCGPGAHCESRIDDLGGNICFRVDYSSRELPSLQELGLNENVGVSGAPGDTDIVLYSVPGPTVRLGPSYGPIDWNGDGDSTGVHVVADIDNNNLHSLLRGFDDWTYVKAQLAVGRVPSRAEIRIVHEPPAAIDPTRRRLQ